MDESFYGITLNEKHQFEQFVFTEQDQTVVQKLVIKQIMLGEDAKEGEFNVVQVQTKVNEKDTLKIPIAVLKAGETRTLNPNIEFPSEAVTFSLIEGKGPVHIYGQHVFSEQYPDFYQQGEEEEDEIEEDDEVPPPQTNGKRKK